MKNLSFKESSRQARPIRLINKAVLYLDVEYLKAALAAMKESHSWRESAMILNPSPFTASAKGDLEKAKLIQLDLMIQLAENAQKIISCTNELESVIRNEEKLNQLFL